MVKNNTSDTLNTFCSACGKKLGQGCKEGQKIGYGDQDKRRFHAKCKKEIDESYDLHMSYIYDETKRNYYDMKKHYNFINKSYTKKAIPTDDTTREEQYKNHMEAKAYAQKKALEFKKKYGYI